MIVQNMIRTGQVSSVNRHQGTVRVLFPDRDNLVSAPLPMLTNRRGATIENSLPDVGQTVVCLFLGNGVETGYCLGWTLGGEDS